MPGIASVIRYWCCTDTNGTLTPAIAPTCRAHWPAQLTTTSQATRPRSVSTAATRPSSSSMPVTCRVLEDARTVHARALRERLRDVGGIHLSVGRQEGGANQVGHIHQRPQRLRFTRRQQLHLEPEGARSRRLSLQLDPARGIAGQPQAAVHLPAARESGLGFERVVERDRMSQQLRDVRAAAQLPDEARGVVRRARRQLVALDDDRVAPAEPGQVIGSRASDDAAADDDCTRLRGKFVFIRHALIILRAC